MRPHINARGLTVTDPPTFGALRVMNAQVTVQRVESGTNRGLYSKLHFSAAKAGPTIRSKVDNAG